MKMLKIILLSLMFPVLVGCWDAVELEELAYVVIIGFDSGENNMINVTYQIANPQVGSTNIAEAQKEKPSDIITILAPDEVTARDTVNTMVSRRISFEHAKAIIISEELAKNDGLFKEIDTFVREPQLETKVNIIICREKASDFIRKNKPVMETRPHKYYNFMAERFQDTGLVPDSTIERFLQRTEGNDEGFIGIYAAAEKVKPNLNGQEDEYKAGEIKSESEDKIQMIGAAVFKKGNMIGTITGEETRLTLLMRKYALAKDWIAVYKDPIQEKEHITARVKRDGSPIYKIDIKSKETDIDVKIKVKVYIENISSNIDYATDLKKQKLLSDSIGKYLEEKTQQFIKKTQEDFKVDLFQFDVPLRTEFWTLHKYEKFNWMKAYPNAKINVKYEVMIDAFGRQIKPADEKRIKD